jgi:hypothetical protein
MLKTVAVFLYGAAYSSAVWIVCIYGLDIKDISPIVTVRTLFSMVGIVFGSAGLIIAMTLYVLKHWNDIP